MFQVANLQKLKRARGHLQKSDYLQKSINLSSVLNLLSLTNGQVDLLLLQVGSWASKINKSVYSETRKPKYLPCLNLL